MGAIVEYRQCDSCVAQGRDTSGDNLAVYEDGSAFCHVCEKYVHADGESTSVTKDKEKGFIQVEYEDLKSRLIPVDVCKRMKYGTGKYKGRRCHIANFYKGGQLVGQKYRFADKTFVIRGEVSGLLYGNQDCKTIKSDKMGYSMIIITEGELDALSCRVVMKAFDVVSVPNGAQSAPKVIKDNLAWLSKYDRVVFAFDNDEAGKTAVDKCVQLMPIGKGYVAALEDKYKDFNEALVAGDEGAISSAVFQAEQWRPDGILSVDQLYAKINTPPVAGLSYPWPTLTRLTYGIRPKEMYTFGAGTGMGKTEFFKEIETHLLVKHDQTVGIIHLEESASETCLGIMNKVAGRTFHIPESGWTNEERDDAFKRTIGTGRVHVYDSFGACDYDTIESQVRYMVRGCGCKFVFLDHLTALTDGEESDRAVNQRMRNIVSSLASLTRELDFTLFAISHLRKASGTPHEEGGRVHLDDLYGASAIKQWASYCFGLERDQQATDEEERHTTTLRVLKDRYTGRALGHCVDIKFDVATTRLQEAGGLGDF